MFKSKQNIQIRLSDLDALGHVNNGIIYSYYDIGRLHYFNQIEDNIQWSNFDKVVVHTECDFKESIFYQDDIYVETQITEFGNKSLSMMQHIVDNTTGKIKSTCRSVLSGYDQKTQSSKMISLEFREKVARLEQAGVNKKQKKS